MGVITMEVMTELAKALGPPNSKIREAHYRRITHRYIARASPEQIMSEVSSPLLTISRQQLYVWLKTFFFFSPQNGQLS